MAWCSHLFKNFPQFVVIHTVSESGAHLKSEIISSPDPPKTLFPNKRLFTGSRDLDMDICVGEPEFKLLYSVL